MVWRDDRLAGRHFLILLVLSAALGCFGHRQGVPLPRAQYALRVGRLLDVRAGRYADDALILVRNDTIVDVLPGARFHEDLADSVLDLRSFTALPGLIDGHVHLGIGGPPAANALADLHAGFTTVVDLGARTHRILAIRDSINAGRIPGPRVLAAGIWIGPKNGVCEFNGIGIAGGPESFAARVRDNAAAGAEIAKLCVSGWPAAAFSRPMEYEMSDAAQSASVEEARRQRLITIAHAISLGGAQAALRAGVQGLAHAAYVDDATAARMRETGTFMIPTLASLTAGDTSRAAAALVLALRRAHDHGVRLVFGTDGGVLPHGRNADEFIALTDAGLTPLEAIRTATTSAAEAFRLSGSVGDIRQGMRADIIAVEGDPLTDVRVLGKPRFVMSRGRVVVPAPSAP